MWETGQNKKERAVLVTVDIPGQDSWTAGDAAGELARLASSSGVQVIKEVICRRGSPTPAYFIGKGKAEELSSLCRSLSADVLIFNEDLDSGQQRNLEEIVQVKTIDRTQLILDIFAQRAKSREGKIQVELAQLEYLLPRLSGKGVLLSRLGAGIGTRGPGEEKLEVDRRRIKERISRMKKELDNLSRRRAALREQRRRHSLPTVAIVGYTNAGKSTLINRLSGAHQIVQDKLFSTLDPLVRGVVLPNGQKILLSDTVGFLHRLPHHLIEAFKATLEEVREADILLHVLDVSSAFVDEQNEAVKEVLKQLGADKKPLITALNKVDMQADNDTLKRYLLDFKNSLAVSALEGTNMRQLLEKISEHLSGLITDIEIFIPIHQAQLVNVIYSEGKVFKKEYYEDKIFIQAQVPVRIKAKLKKELRKNRSST